MPEHQNNEATLQLTILDAENLKDMKFLGKMKTFAVAWIDPRFKKPTKTLTTSTRNPTYNHSLPFPLTLQTLQNPNSCITIQILSPPSRIHRERVIGTAVMSLADVRFDEQVFTLQLWRPSGRACGLLRVSARVEFDLLVCTPPGCVTGIPMQQDQMAGIPSGYNRVVPSAPNEDDLVELSQVEESCSVEWSESREMRKATEMSPLETSSVQLRSLIGDQTDSVESGSSTEVLPETTTPDGPSVLKSFLVGLLGGTVAVATVLIGSNAG